MLRVHLFGGLALAWDEGSLPPIPGTVARSLFAYLVTYRDRPHTRDLLAGTFWPDLPDATARRRLSKALWQIGHAFRTARGTPSQEGQDKAGPPLAVLVTEGDTVQLHPGLRLWLDVEEFGQQIAGSRQQKFGPAVDGLLRAAELYRGEFLAGYYDDWAVLERERLQGMLLEALGRLVARYKGWGEYEPALRFARRLAAEEPWREEAHREVMRLCHLLGEHTEALKQFEICRQSLIEELGVDPSPETVALADEIASRSGLSRPPLLPTAAHQVRAPLLERPDRLPLVGRQKELAELLRQVEAMVGGSGGLTILHGEAGVGKSRLLRELADNARWRGVRAVWGRCYELAAPPAYQPLVEALRVDLPALDRSALEPLWQAELSRLLPELATGEGPPPPLPPEEEQRRLLEAIARGLLALADTAPTLVLLEDAQWMDAASLDALRYLLPRLGEAPLLGVVTTRTEDLAGQRAEALSAMESTRLARRLELGRLGQAETGELVQHALGLEEPAPRFSARLHSETEGNPFFLVETLWTLVEEGLLYRDEAGAWSTRWDESTEGYAELPLPPGVVQSIERRLARLPGRLNELLDLAAVIGRRLGFPLWCSASGRDEGTLLAAGDALCARGLLLASDPDYVFAHDQIRRVAYRRLAPARRRLYHRRVAEALTELEPGEPAALAYHWTQAEVWDRALEYHRRAGDRAQKVFANRVAVAHYTQALDALERLPGSVDPVLGYELHLAREAVYDLLGEREAQAEELKRLEELAEELDDGRRDADGAQGAAMRRAEVALRQAAYSEATGDYPTAIAAVQMAVESAQAARDIGLEAQSYRQWGRALWQQGTLRDACSLIEKALDLVRDADLQALEAKCLHDLGLVFYQQSDYSEARTHFERSLNISSEIGDRLGVGSCLHGLGTVSRLQGDFAGARTHYERTLHIRREIGDRMGEGQTLLSLGIVSDFQGDYVEAIRRYKQCLRVFREIGNRRGEASVFNNLGIIAQLQGDMAGSRAYRERALFIMREVGDRLGEARCLNNLGNCLVVEGNYGGDAKSHFERALCLFRDVGNREGESIALTNLGYLCHRLGDYARARTYYEEALRISGELGDQNQESDALSRMSLLLHDLGDHQAALEYGQHALHIARDIGNRSHEASAWMNLGYAHMGLSHLAEAGAAFQRATDLYRELDTQPSAVLSLSGLARVVLALGDLALAQRQAEEILAHLETGTLKGAKEPLLEIYLACYQVLRVKGDPRAEEVVIAAYDLLQEQAVSIGDETLERSFLENVAVHQKIVAAHHDLQASQQAHRITVSLPRADAPLGRPLREDEFLTITWTVAAPEDETVGYKVARRRKRILRLLRQARAQGAAPTHSHLAEALGVSRRTIERDMAAMHRQEDLILPPTRGEVSE